MADIAPPPKYRVDVEYAQTSNEVRMGENKTDLTPFLRVLFYTNVVFGIATLFGLVFISGIFMQGLSEVAVRLSPLTSLEVDSAFIPVAQSLAQSLMKNCVDEPFDESAYLSVSVFTAAVPRSMSGELFCSVCIAHLGRCLAYPYVMAKGDNLVVLAARDFSTPIYITGSRVEAVKSAISVLYETKGGSGSTSFVF